MIRWTNLVVPVVSGAAAALFADLAFWEQSRQAFLVVLSVIAAGVLVRIARPQPFSNPDFYELDEIRNLTKAVGQITRSLRALFILVLVGMVALVLAYPIAGLVRGLGAPAAVVSATETAISGILGFVLGYVLFRMLQVVRGDEELTKLQSSYIVRAVERRQAEQFDNLETKAADVPFKNPEGYGRVIQ